MQSEIERLIGEYPSLSVCASEIETSFELLASSFEHGGRLYICGNGGSASDAIHIVGELVKSFRRSRELDERFKEVVRSEISDNLQGALPAFSLVESAALISAYANDVNPEYIYAQQVYAYVRKDDCVLGISTSGNSSNILRAMETARGREAVILGLSGGDGGQLKALCDSCIVVPQNETYKIQELHLPIYHAICLMLEDYFWKDGK